ncbi:MAG: bifunctional phosphoribosylaminoimidazolecarboxamide formyltransferase/IMP cyclohydrolase [Oenococcus sp.]|uniref:bifunctional phosphoribosylaminoimidazolecarboxamide formyltransferase/IMP cyclohydrolase n=1 Tax=Oenococcus sp. TaxID=1979414 RepID=UPI0039ECBB24
MKRALLSVSDKTGLVDFAKGLVENDYELISTGGTLKTLQDADIPAKSITEITHFPEILDGRVKTLHPAVHAALLAKRENADHMATLKELDITPIDLVAVNLYPFKETVSNPNATYDQAIENIDIGGPSMIRSAAKNAKDVLVLVDPADYAAVLTAISENQITDDLRRTLQAKAFRHTAAYDALIASYLSKTAFPEKLTLTYEKDFDLRYGENPHQKAAVYANPIPTPYSILQAKILHGKKLSYNNIKDADAALRTILEFNRKPTVVTLKHMNPAGIGQADTIEKAWDKAFAADDISIFGGIVVANREIDLATATKMHAIFLEIIIAPSFTPEAFDMLAKKKNLRLLSLPIADQLPKEIEVTSVLGGAVAQEMDDVVEEEADLEVVSEKQPTAEQISALIFAQKAVKHVKSNAILVATDGQTLGIGAGQPNRIDSVKIAIAHAETKPDFANAVLASDAFFPMDDSVSFAASKGISAIVEPGGSIKDKNSIAMANKLGVVLVFSHRRHFRH